MIFPGATKLGTTICQYTKQRYAMLFIEWDDPVIQHISSNKFIFAIIQFGLCSLGMSIDECLLIDSTHALYCPDIISSLITEITRVLSLYFAIGFFFLFFSFQSGDMGFS